MPHGDQHQISGISWATSTLDLRKVLCWSLGGAVSEWLSEVLKMIEKWEKSQFRLIYWHSHGNTRCLIRTLSMFTCIVVLCLYTVIKTPWQ